MGLAFLVAGFEELLAYRRSVVLADELRIAVATWGSFDMWTVGIQLVRAADSIGANIAEAYGRRTRAGRLINGLARSWA